MMFFTAFLYPFKNSANGIMYFLFDISKDVLTALAISASYPSLAFFFLSIAANPFIISLSTKGIFS